MWADCLAVRSSPLLLRWGEFAARQTLYDSLSKHNVTAYKVAARLVRRPPSWGTVMLDVFTLALSARMDARSGTPCGCNDGMSYYVLLFRRRRRSRGQAGVRVRVLVWRVNRSLRRRLLIG